MAFQITSHGVCVRVRIRVGNISLGSPDADPHEPGENTPTFKTHCRGARRGERLLPDSAFGANDATPWFRLRLPGAVPSTNCSTLATICSASSLRPWIINQRGLSGIHCRKKITTNPRVAPMPNAQRQPNQIG